MADKCTKKGWCCCSILLFFIACIVGGFIFGGMSNPNGELETWFAVEGCWSENASITVANRGAFDAYLMRPARGYQVGSACPTDTSGFAAFGYNEMVLEKTNGESDSEEDGGTPLGDDFRLGGEYSPLFLLPSDSYATMSIEILDSTGAIIYPTAIFSLGKDEGYPWQAPVSDISTNVPIPTSINENSRCSCTCSRPLPLLVPASAACEDAAGRE